MRLIKSQGPLFDKLQGIKTEIAVADFLDELAFGYGFDGFMLVDIPTETERSLSSQIRISNMPLGFVEEYDALGLLKESPVFATLRRSSTPTVWKIDPESTDGPSSTPGTARQLFARFQLTIGVYIPVHAPSGARAAIGFIGDRDVPSGEELGQLGLLAMHAHDIYAGLKQNDGASECSLTPREIEVLHWAANGKTSTEIATIVSLSDHTVNTYMNNAMRKLDCVNRTQLVAKALRLRLIS